MKRRTAKKILRRPVRRAKLAFEQAKRTWLRHSPGTKGQLLVVLAENARSFDSCMRTLAEMPDIPAESIHNAIERARARRSQMTADDLRQERVKMRADALTTIASLEDRGRVR